MKQNSSGSFSPVKIDSLTIFEIMKELDRWPSSLQYICRPTNVEEQKQYAENIRAWQAKSKTRHTAFSLWSKYRKYYSLSARKWPLHKILTMVTILLKKRDINDQWKSRSNFNGDDDGVY